MKVNGFKCDICSNIGNENQVKGWYFVRFHEGNASYREHHLCSLECLRLWIPKHPVASEFVDESESTKVTLSDRVY